MLARVNARPRRRNAGRPFVKSAPGYLKWLRGRACHLADKGGCTGKVRACHVDCAGGKGMGAKVSDRHAIPMCDGHHGQQHRLGWRTFQTTYGFDAVATADAFWQAWPKHALQERDWAEALA
jgi:hypothetical protein